MLLFLVSHIDVEANYCDKHHSDVQLPAYLRDRLLLIKWEIANYKQSILFQQLWVLD
jgi:hypothetical protein